MTVYTLSDVYSMNVSDILKNDAILAIEKYESENNTPNTKVFFFGYTNYGGSFADKVIIEWAKKYHASDIVFETTAWDGQNAILFGDAAQDFKTDWYNQGEEELSDLYDTMSIELREEALKNTLADEFEVFPYDVMNDVSNALRTGLDYSGHEEPNFYDFDLDTVVKYAQEELDENNIGIKLNEYRV